MTLTDITLSELQAVQSDGNAFTCDLAIRMGIPLDAWIYWAQFPDAKERAERFATKAIANLTSTSAP